MGSYFFYEKKNTIKYIIWYKLDSLLLHFWTKFCTPEWQGQVRAITKEAVLALEEAKRSLSAETAKKHFWWKKRSAFLLLKMHKGGIKMLFPNLGNVPRLRCENANCLLWSWNVLPKMLLDKRKHFFSTPLSRQREKNKRNITCSEVSKNIYNAKLLILIFNWFNRFLWFVTLRKKLRILKKINIVFIFQQLLTLSLLAKQPKVIFFGNLS